MRIHLRYLLAVMMVLLMTGIAPSCKKKKNPAPSSNDTTSVPTVMGTYKMYETGQINFKNSYEKGATIDAQVNGQATTLVAANDTVLIFLAMPPAFKVGDNQLAFSIDGVSQQLNIKIEEAQAIGDPNTEFTNYTSYYEDQVNQFNTLGGNDTTGIFNSAEFQDAFNEFKAQLNELKNKWPTLSQEEKEATAHFIKANQQSYAEFNTQLKAMCTNIPSAAGSMARYGFKFSICDLDATLSGPALFKCHATNFIDAASAAIILGSATYVAAKLNVLPVAIALAAAGGASLTWMVYSGLRLGGVNFKPITFNIDGEWISGSEQRTTAKTIEFVKGQGKTLPVVVTLRNLAARDATSTSSLVQKTVAKINEYNAFVDKSSFLKKFRINIPTEKNNRFYVGKMSYLTARVTANSKVTFGGISGTPKAPVFTFNTNETSEQAFSFEVVYDDGLNPSITIPMQGKILDGSSFCSFSDVNQMIQQHAAADPDYPVGYAGNNMHAFDEQFHYVLKGTNVACYDNAGNLKKTIALQPSKVYFVSNGYTTAQLLVHNGYFWLYYMPSPSGDYTLDKLNMNDGSLVNTVTTVFPSNSSYLMYYESICMIGNTGYMLSNRVHTTTGEREYWISSVDINSGAIEPTPVYKVDKNSSGTWKNMQGPICALNNTLYILNEFNGNIGTGNVLKVTTSGQAQVVMTGSYNTLINICNKIYAYDKNTSRYVAVP